MIYRLHNCATVSHNLTTATQVKLEAEMAGYLKELGYGS